MKFDYVPRITDPANQFHSPPYFQRTFVSWYKYKYFFSNKKLFIIKIH